MFKFLKPKPKKPQDTTSVDTSGPGSQDSDDIDALMRTAAAAARSGNPEGAIAAYSQVIDANPGHAPAHYKRGNVYKDQGQVDAAIAGYDQAILLEPKFVQAFCNRGVVLDGLGRWEEALISYEHALAIDPTDAVSHHNRAMVLRKLDRRTEALASFERAIAINPSYAEAYCNRGTLLQDMKQWAEALASYDRSIALQPSLSLAYFNRGALYQERRLSVQALADYDKAIELDPGCAAAHCNRGAVLGDLKRSEEGLASIDRALALAPNSINAHFSRAEALMATKEFETAIASYDLALGFKRTHPFLLGSRRFANSILCDWSGIDADIDDIASGLDDGQPVATPFHVMALVDDPGLQHRAAQIWSALSFPGFPADRSMPGIEDPVPRHKIHLGYFSADFYEHPVGLLTAELFETHDRSQFEVTAFSFGPDTPDALSMRLQRGFDRFVDVRSMSDQRVTALARELHIDIAVDLGGHTRGARTGIFAMRAAPLQVNYLGYAGTMGADFIDYLIADPISVPESTSRHYSEQVVHLPHSFLPNDSRREIADAAFTREQCRLPSDAFVFCCFNNSYKINPPVFDAWMNILRRVDNSVLWLSNHHPKAASNLRKEASQRGIDPARLIIADRAALQTEYLARLRLGDLFLDTLPYNAHTTAIDALWAGLPVLTRIGRGFAGRVGASLLNAIDLGELVTSTVDEYQDLAVDLAKNPDRLAAIRHRLTENRLAAPLFDTVSFTRHLESAYLQMHAQRLAGQPPKAFSVESRRDDVDRSHRPAKHNPIREVRGLESR